MSFKRVKVNDRRMFTQDGELREEFSHLADAAPPAESAPDRIEGDDRGSSRDLEIESRAPGGPGRDRPGRDRPGRDRPGRDRPGHDRPGHDRPAMPAPADPGPRVAGYPERQGGREPGLLDLVGLLAEPASAYLREAQAGDPGTVAGDNRSEQNLELARLHIDLLATLRDKTAGNLGSQEAAMLDDVLYRLRTGYVQIRAHATR